MGVRVSMHRLVVVGVWMVVIVCVAVGMFGFVGMVVMGVIFFGGVIAFVDVDFDGGDAVAIDFSGRECSVEIECGYCLVKDFGIDSGVDESSEEHVAADAGEAVEVGDTHEVIVS